MSELDDEIKIEKVNLVNDLDTIEKEIVSLKKLYSEINNYPNILIGLFNKKFTKQLNLIEASKPGTKYQEALTNLVLKKYIPNPEASETGFLNDVKKFFTDIPNWIIDNPENYKSEQKIYDKERKNTDEFDEDVSDNKIDKLLNLENNVSVSREQLKYFGLTENDRPDFSKYEELNYKTYYGNTFIKPNGCDLQGELIISDKDYESYKKEIKVILNEINSTKFKEDLISVYNKQKDIIKNVSLNILLGKRNKIKDRLNKFLNRDRHIERLKKQKNTEGYIYILTNKSFPNYLKIGSTMKEPSIRADELNGTGLPFPYEVKIKFLTRNCEILEKKVHSILDKKRVNLEREFFECTVTEAKQIIEKVIKDAR